MSPTGGETVRVPATIFPGVFDREYQATVSLSGRTINVTVSEDFVEFKESPDENGVSGFLKVNVVDITGETVIVALPGEVQGATSRATTTRGELQAVA